MNSDGESLYDILGITKNATDEEIKSAYRKKMKEEHSDVNPNFDEEKFLNIRKAYETLSDKRRRAQYDETGHILPESSEIQSKVLNLVREKFYQQLNLGNSLFSTDMIDNMLKELDTDLGKKRKSVVQYKEKKVFLKKVQKRLKKKKSDNYIIEHIIQEEFGQVNLAINSELNNIEIIELSKKAVSEYEFDFVKRIIEGVKIEKEY